jgi:hypothetical protein
MELVFAPNGGRNQAGPVDRHGVGGLAGDDPERRLVGEIPRDDGAFVGVPSPELGREIGLEAQHFGIGVRVPTMSPRHIPIRLPDLAADEQRGMQIDFVLVRQ